MTRHLTPAAWARAERRLLRKALAEFSHERLLDPEPVEGGGFVVPTDDGTVEYRFTADRFALGHWSVDEDSISRHRSADGTALTLNALEFFVELRRTLGLSDQVLPVYLEEISATLASTCYHLAQPELSAAELARADFQVVERSMSEGHPCFVANNGRLGFGGDDYLAYAPESARAVRLIWVAAHRDRAAFHAGAGVRYEALLRDELGAATLDRFDGVLRARGLDPAEYVLIPVHPWQWRNKLALTFAAELAREHLVLLGESDDTYLAQQSVRTFFNDSHRAKHYVKTSLSVVNMGFMRGLSAAYMSVTPAINDWLVELVEGDRVLRTSGLAVIRECAAVGYRHLEYEQATTRVSPYRKMLAALWRESPVPLLDEGERLVTMASLLHIDSAGGTVVGALVEESGLPADDWLRRYLDAYLTPLLHSLYAHDLAFMPHGENVILVLADGAVRRVIFKDIAEEIAVMSPHRPLPPEAERIRVTVPDDQWLLPVFTDVFDGYFRFLSQRMHTGGVLEETEFWRTVAVCVADYQRSMPELADKFARFDLFADSLPLSCHNRLQLRDNTQMVDLTDPSGSMQLVGTLKNPLAHHRDRGPAPARPQPVGRGAPGP
ncbi:IucA/IucC family protein [Streptomyces rubiginosohelvolus]|uniref:IucA/IucC family protein n=1 Tax=Streptomyces rubiginosohelvolus TaxID=67362 RepID=UPI0037A25EA0